MKKILLISKVCGIILLLLFFCCKKKIAEFPDTTNIPDLIRPIKLEPDSMVLYLQDYILDINLIDSLTFSEGISFNYLDAKHNCIVLHYNNSNLPYYNFMHLWVQKYAYTIILEKSEKIPYHFTFFDENDLYQKVSIVGNFNEWVPDSTPLVKKEGVWQVMLTLDPGLYYYQIKADTAQFLDTYNKDSVSNNFGGYNSLLEIAPITNGSEARPVLYTETSTNNIIEIGFVNHIDTFYGFWNNYQLKNISIDRKNRKIRIPIPNEAGKEDFSFIRIFSENKTGKSNDLLLPLKEKSVIDNSSVLSRSHKEAQIYYFLLVDRFFNGNKENDFPVEDPEVDTKANYQGGDLVGLIQKIKEGYFDSLNIKTIWLSPITQNPLKAYREFPKPYNKYSGYHGYWPIHSTQIDHRFGTEQCLKSLVEDVHKKDMNIILDYVCNHVHEDNPLYKNNPHWATPMVLKDSTINIRKFNEHRLTTWFDEFLPSFDFSREEVIDTLVNLALFWIKEYNIDGFRHDATKHIPLSFWRKMTLELKRFSQENNNKTFLQIGETFGSRDLIGSYVGTGLIDGQFDFELYFDARSVFALDAQSFNRIKKSLNASFSYYGSNSLMGNITGNHDLPRFTSLASGDLKFDEDAKAAAWHKNIEITDSTGYAKMQQMFGFILTIPGIPVFYYGDEIGMAGADDPDNRRMMRFDSLETAEKLLRNNVRKLSACRAQSMCFNYGHFEWLQVDDKTMVYARKYFNEKAIVLFNKDKSEKRIQLHIPVHLISMNFKAVLNTPFEIKNNRLTIRVPAYGVEILFAKE